MQAWCVVQLNTSIGQGLAATFLALTQNAVDAILMPFWWDKDVLPAHTREGVVLNAQRSVLIVDRSAETREVLQTVLERRGVRTLSAGGTAAGWELARRHRPDLIVFDLELDNTPSGRRSDSSSEPSVAPTFGWEDDTADSQYRPRLVLLGNLRGWCDAMPDGEFVRKPYHYGPLIRRIEELLASDTQSGSLGRADVVRHPRIRPGQPL